MTVLNRSQILDARDRKTKDVEVPEWGGTVRIAAISADTLLKFRDLSKRKDKGEDVDRDMMSVMIVGSVVDENGVELFTDEDAPALLKKNPNTVAKLFMEALELNNLKPKEGEDGPVINPLEEARKNS